MLAAASAHHEADLLEVGSWCGRSAIALGLAARLTGRGAVHCIDLFPERDDWYRNEDGTFSMRVQLQGVAVDAYTGQRVWAEAFERDIRPLYAKNPSLYAMFQETIATRGLEQVVKPFRGTLQGFLAAAPKDFRCRLAFLDGDHGYEAVCSDISRISERLVPGGWLCFDDAFTTYEGVDRAIRDLVIGKPAFDFSQQLTRKFFVARKALA
jgi:predicted O-methyltransferase YrrM